MKVAMPAGPYWLGWCLLTVSPPYETNLEKRRGRGGEKGSFLCHQKPPEISPIWAIYMFSTYLQLTSPRLSPTVAGTVLAVCAPVCGGGSKGTVGAWRL